MQKQQKIKTAVIAFEFDDGDVRDAELYSIFKANNMVCGFALIADRVAESRVSEYLQYQKEGFEILAHNTDPRSEFREETSMTVEEADARFEQTLKKLTDYGFTVKSWVTPMSYMHPVFRPYLMKYYDSATTIYKEGYTGSNYIPYMTRDTEMNEMFRVSLQMTAPENQKKAVDETIANKGFLIFYGHAAKLDGTDYETTDNLNELLSYVNAYRNTQKCIVLKPSDAVDLFFYTNEE